MTTTMTMTKKITDAVTSNAKACATLEKRNDDAVAKAVETLRKIFETNGITEKKGAAYEAISAVWRTVYCAARGVDNNAARQAWMVYANKVLIGEAAVAAKAKAARAKVISAKVLAATPVATPVATPKADAPTPAQGATVALTNVQMLSLSINKSRALYLETLAKLEALAPGKDGKFDPNAHRLCIGHMQFLGAELQRIETIVAKVARA